jgi:GntR family transcriptional regulator of arabinose operon
MAKRRVTTEPHVPMHQRVLEALLQEILTGKYKPGQKFPSEAGLVQQFGTSRITIGRAVNELERRGLVERIAGSGTYVRMRGATRATFGLLVPDLGRTEVFDPICRGIAGAPDAVDYALLWGHDVGPLELCEQFIEHGVSGVFFAPLEEREDAEELNLEIVARLEKARIAIVLLDRCYMRYPLRSRYDLVGIDNRRAGFLAADYLVRAGARRVAFVGHARGAATVDARMAGYLEAMRGRWELALRLDSWDRLMDEHREHEPDGYVCANDRTAGLLMRALLFVGVRIPGDVRIVGIDDVEYASSLPVPLTTVHQPCREMGQAALGAMIERIRRPGMLARDILVECRLVVRESG